MESAKFHFALYARESTKWQAQNGYNLEDQKKRMISYCNACFDPDSYTYSVYEEAGASAKTLERPVLNQMIEDINRGKVTHVVIYSIDRLSRTIMDLIEFVELLQYRKVQLMSVTEKIDTETPQGRFFLQLLGLLAQLERENISERTRRSLLESASQGNFAKSTVPIGYRKIDKKLVIDEKESEIVKQTFELIASGTSPCTLASQYRKENVLGLKWQDSKIYALIRNKLYKGTYTVQNVELDNHSPAIVSEELWQKANDSLLSEKRKTKHCYLYKEMCYCQTCNKKMTGTSTYNAQKKVYIYYQCSSCGLKISQNSITEQIDDYMTANYRNNKLKKFVHANVDGLNKKEKTALKNLSVNSLLYSIEDQREADSIKGLGIIESNLIERIIQLRNLLLSKDYTSLTVNEKRRELDKHIGKMYFNSSKKLVKKEKKEKKRNLKNK